MVSRPGCAAAGLILAILLSASQPGAVAAPITAKQAAAVVAGWLSLERKPLGETLGPAVQSVERFSDKTGNPLYYVVYLDPSGFVIVAGDDLVEPIIGFARTGKFDPSENNPLGALVTKDLSGRVAYAREVSAASPGKSALQAQTKWQQLGAEDGKPSSTAKSLTSVSDVRIAPFTQTTWDQGTAGNVGTTACYNYYTPPYGDGNVNNYWAGCVATATAQLIRYYQFPTTGVGYAGFTIYADGSPLTYYLHGGNGSGGPYVWSNMPLVPTSSPSTAQCQAIGALVADVGAAVGMSYYSGGSSASLSDAKDALLTTFDFANARYANNYNSDISAGLASVINPNLDARYPVLLSITGPNGGHAVVPDGYGYSGPTNAPTLYHHLNLGWSGTATAWYALPQIDAGNYTFTVVDGCVYNAYTNGSGEIISGRVLDQLGRPVVNATVTATRSPSGTYTSTTDTNGIYALARIPSSSSFSITVTKANYSSVSGNASTGTSSDWSATSGNYWGASFTMPMLTAVLDHLGWNAVAPAQYLSTPFGVTITALNVTNGVASGFIGTVALSAYKSGFASTNVLVGNLGAFQTATDPSWSWTFGYTFIPSTNLQAISVRTYSGSKVTIYTDTGTFIASQNVSSPAGIWTETPLDTPVMLSAGTPYRLTVCYPPGTTRYLSYWAGEWPTTFANGTIGQTVWNISADSFPTYAGGTGLGPFLDLRYTVPFSNAVPISPTTSGSFVSGVWSGNVTISQVATNVVLKADDGAGHIALSSPFNVTTPIRLLSPQRVAGGKFQCTISSAAGLKIEMLCSTNLSSWSTVTNLTNSTGTMVFTDPATNLVRRYYRAHQLP